MYERHAIALVECGPGNIGAGIEAERAIAYFHPRVASFVGVAGGLKDVSLGDVVCATKVYGYEGGKAAVTFLPRPQQFSSAYALVQAARSAARTNQWQALVKLTDEEMSKWSPSDRQAFVAQIAAGEKVVSSVSAPEFNFLRNSCSDAVAVEMEGIGLLQAGYTSGIECVVIRGISDLVGDKNEADKSGSQPRAAAAAAAFLVSVLSERQGVRAREFKLDWGALERLSFKLYPTGPSELQVWSRSGGDMSHITPGLPGRAAWHEAIKLLRNGGGRMNISVRCFLSVMHEDFTNNSDIAKILCGCG